MFKNSIIDPYTVFDMLGAIKMKRLFTFVTALVVISLLLCSCTFRKEKIPVVSYDDNEIAVNGKVISSEQVDDRFVCCNIEEFEQILRRL